MRIPSATIVCLHLLRYFSVIKSSADERAILDLIFKERGYNYLERPVKNDSQAVVVYFTLTLQQIIDVAIKSFIQDEKNQVIKSNLWLQVDEKNQVINTNIWLTMEWQDYNLAWNPEKYGNVSAIRLPPSLIWKPDILMYNSADEKFDGTYPTNIVIDSNGNTLYVPPGMFKSTCRIDITWFPFDDQECPMKFGSWTYDGTKIDLRLKGDEGDMSSFMLNGEWKLLGLKGKRSVLFYECCPDQPYLDVTFTIHIRRKKLYYLMNIVLPCLILSWLTLLSYLIPPDAGEKVAFGLPAKLDVQIYDCCPDTPYQSAIFTIKIRRRTLFFVSNLIIPCMLVSAVTLLTFSLPPDSGEKISLSVTILLSLTVFLLLVAESMPPTSDAVSLIGLYFSFVMLMCSFSVAFTVVVLNLHHRGPATHTMPRWVKVGICEWLAWMLRMKRPKGNKQPNPSARENTSVGMGMGIRSPRTERYPRFTRHPRDRYKFDSRVGLTHQHQTSDQPVMSHSLLANVLDMEDDYMGHNGMPLNNQTRGVFDRQTTLTNRSDSVLAGDDKYCVFYNHELKEMNDNLKFVVEKMKNDEKESSEMSDWKFAAMVVDRCCFLTFLLLSVVSTAAIILSAPHIFEP